MYNICPNMKARIIFRLLILLNFPFSNFNFPA
nr:MAG TPA: hypothetical protein [Caudoviricetes sp.]